MKPWFTAAAFVLLAACGQPPGDADPKADPAATAEEAPDTAATLVTDTWIGRWSGPEGLFLDIKPAATPGAYALTIKANLDTQGDYAGRADAEVIRFERDGKAETIKAGTGAQTGFKHLDGKRDCLIVVEGAEGYCRD